ncbi:MAG: hypothetical protein LC723_12255 [Actinobacteria bacterium]|nr:hypothetical protein [Actinomycetota bacterium]
MRCPECSNVFGDNIRGRLACSECNTSLVVIAKPGESPYPIVRETVRVEREKTPQERKAASRVKHIYILGKSEEKPDYSIRCNFCQSPVPKMTAVRGNIITGWKPTEVYNAATKQVDIKNVPQFREVHSCFGCMTLLNAVLPDKVVNPTKDDKNGVVRTIRDVTHDTARKDENDTTPCAEFVPFHADTYLGAVLYTPMQCVHCGRPENVHTNTITECRVVNGKVVEHKVADSKIVDRKVYAESFNRR